jgi:signal transduction histidine kinase
LSSPTSDRRKTLDILEHVVLAGRGVTASIFLERVCRAVADAFDFDCVAAMLYDAEAEEVSAVASAGPAPAERVDRQPIATVSLLVRAREARGLVFDSAGPVTSAFALPLISGSRCLGFLSGRRGTAVSRIATDGDALTTVGIVATTLLENALELERMQQRDVLKSEFIALAVHELRNPLSSIYGISITLNERGDDLAGSQRSSLRDALREQTTRMRNLVEQLLDLSRLDLAAIHISPEPVRLRPKIEELVRPLADVRPSAVRVAVPPGLEAVVDPAALDRMLSNLIANSLRHGQPPVTITASGQDRHLRLVVEDRGGGVPDEFVPRLFHRFTRGPDSNGRSEGSGLGLTIAQAYARAHGGEIVYEPAVPHGARFEVVIPLRGYGDEHPGSNPRGPKSSDPVPIEVKY